MMHARLMCFVFDVSGFQNETEDGSPPSGFVAFRSGNLELHALQTQSVILRSFEVPIALSTAIMRPS